MSHSSIFFSLTTFSFYQYSSADNVKCKHSGNGFVEKRRRKLVMPLKKTNNILFIHPTKGNGVVVVIMVVIVSISVVVFVNLSMQTISFQYYITIVMPRYVL